MIIRCLPSEQRVEEVQQEVRLREEAERRLAGALAELDRLRGGRS